MNRYIALLLAGLWPCLGLAATRGPEAAPRPNIVVFLIDDLGWADVSYHGGQIRTPNIDRLAAAGTRLEQFYVQPLCSPTRAALMTGRYPMRHGLQLGVVKPHAQYGLPLEERTLPQALSSVGYTTAIVGKWHLGHFRPEYLPTRRGFQHQYGHYNGAIDYFTHERDGGLDWHRNDRGLREEGYSTHLIAAEAERIIERQEKGKPLFLYVPFNAVHSPHQVPEEYTKPYPDMQGARRTYAGMVTAMDEAIGRIVAAVEQRGLRQNTLFVFSSDNGGPSPGKVTDNGPLRAGKSTLYEGGVRVPAFATWEGRVRAGAVVNEPLHIVDWYPTLLTLAGAPLEQPLPLDGRDAWPAIAQGQPSPHEEILLNTTSQSGAIRVGDWKLVVNGSRPDSGDASAAPKKKGKKAQSEGEQIELFNLAQDPYEKTNLAEQSPEKLRELMARLDSYAKAAAPEKVRPPSPDFKVPKVWGEVDEAAALRPGEASYVYNSPWMERTAEHADQFLQSIGYLKASPRVELPKPGK